MAEHQHRATAEHWDYVKRLASNAVAYSTILELRDRIEALEAAQPPKSNHPEIPDSSLVEQVEDVIFRSGNEPGFRAEARAAIREVAAWMGEQIRYGVSLAWVVERLEEEAER